MCRIVIAVACLLAAVSVTTGQSNKPAVEYQSLMNLRFYEADGGFLVEHLQIVFPPPGSRKGAFVITKTGGGEVARVPLRFEALGFPAFGLLEPDGVPGGVKVGQPGDYQMSVVMDGQAITMLPFSLKEEVSADPFRPGRRFVREGPFRELAYFSVLPDDPGGQVQFNYWLSLRELPPGAKNARVTIHLLANGQEIAASRGPVVPTVNDWQFFQHQGLSMPTIPQNRWLTLGDMTKKDGELTLVVKANGQPVKSYRTRVSGGQLQRLPQNSLDAEPHTAFISPRFIDTSRQSPARDKMFDMYWLRKSDR